LTPLISTLRAFSVTEREAGAEQVVGIGKLAAAASLKKSRRLAAELRGVMPPTAMDSGLLAGHVTANRAAEE